MTTAGTGRGATAYPTLGLDELTSATTLVNRGETIAHLESCIHLGDVLAAQANGNYAIFTLRGQAYSRPTMARAPR